MLRLYSPTSQASLRSCSARRGECLSLNNLGGIYVYTYGRLRKAVSFFERSLALREGLGDERGIGFVKILLGLAYSRAGEYIRAKQAYDEAMEINRGRKDQYMINYGLVCEGELQFDLWNVEAIVSTLNEIEATTAAIGSPHYSRGNLYYLNGLCHSEKGIDKADSWVEKESRCSHLTR